MTPESRHDVAFTDRRLGAAAVVVGLVLAAWAQLVAPLAQPPLYDGVIVVEPYRYLSPGPGQRGSPASAFETDPLQNGASPTIAVATSENPPQAQIFANPGAFTLAPGTHAVKVRVAPERPPSNPPPGGRIVGNVYGIEVMNQAGVALTAPSSAQVSVVLRAPSGISDATIERFAGGSWKPLATTPETSDLFLATATTFGTFALVAPSRTSPSGAPPPVASLALSSPLVPSNSATAAPPSSPPSEAGGASGGVPWTILIAAAGVALLGAALVRLSRR